MNDYDRLNRICKWTNMGLGDYIALATLGQLGLMTYTGQRFFVNPTATRGNDNNDGSFGRPYATLAKAVSMAVAGRGDVIFIQSGCGTDLTDIDVDLTTMTDLSIVGLNAPSGGFVRFKSTTDPTTAIIKLAAASARILIANIRFDCTGDGGKDVVAINSTGASAVNVLNCQGVYGTFINTTNAASSSNWRISGNTLINTDSGIVGYLNLAEIDNNRIIKTVTTALTVGISLLDNTTTADSDGALVHHNAIFGGIEGTTPMANGIVVAAACYGVGVYENRVAGCTANVTVTQNTAGAHSVLNLTEDQRAGGGEWADAETYLGAA